MYVYFSVYILEATQQESFLLSVLSLSSLPPLCLSFTFVVIFNKAPYTKANAGH